MAIQSTLMKAVFWEGKPFHVAVRDVAIPTVVNADDAIVRVTTAAICGSDLHIYHGVSGSPNVPYPIGHEAIGIVTAVGAGTTAIKVGDRVIVPAAADTGRFDFAPQLFPSDAETFGEGSAFGVPLGGCQAEFVRVPFADKSLIPINGFTGISDADFITLADIFATAWGGLEFSGFQPGDVVAVFGAGPVGLLVAYSALLRGASRVYSIDHIEQRLKKAESIGAIPIDFSKGSPAAQILALEPAGVQRVCDAVGEEQLNSALKPQENFIVNEAATMASFRGGIALIGEYAATGTNTDGAPRGATLAPTIAFPISTVWEKSLSIGSGGVDPKLHTQPLFELVTKGRAHPGLVFTRAFHGLDKAEEAYRVFDKKQEIKVLFKFDWQQDETSAEPQASQVN